jgi:hypothetical protein
MRPAASGRDASDARGEEEAEAEGFIAWILCDINFATLRIYIYIYIHPYETMGTPMRIASALSDGPRGAILLSPVTRSSLSPTSLAASALSRDSHRSLSSVKFVQVTDAGVEIPYIHPRSLSSGSHAYPATFSLPRLAGSAAPNPNSRTRSPRDRSFSLDIRSPSKSHS